MEHFFCLIVIIPSLLSGRTAQFGNIQYYRRSDQYPLPERQSSDVFPGDGARSHSSHLREEHLNHGHLHHSSDRQRPVTQWVEHSRNDAIPFNMVPDTRRNERQGRPDSSDHLTRSQPSLSDKPWGGKMATSYGDQEERGRNDYTSSSRRGDNVAVHERNDVNMSTIYDIFFKNSTKRALDDQASNCTEENINTTSSSCHFGLCEDVDEYPEDKIKKFISGSRILRQYFDQHQIPGVSFNNRFGEDGDPLCPTRIHTVFPRSAPNTQNVKKMIVNVDEYKQGVIYETCVREGGQCSQSSEFPNGFTTSCKQKYAVRRLMAISGDMEEPVFDDFELPSCCVCMIKKA